MNKLLYLLRFLHSSGFNAVYSILPSYLSTAFSALSISYIQSAYALPRLISIPCGWLSDMFGKRRTIAMVFLSFSVVAYAFTLQHSIIYFAILFFIVGVISTFFYPSINALVTVYSSKKTENLFRLESAYQLGVVAGPVVGGFLMMGYGIDAAFYAWTLLSVIGLAVSGIILRKKHAVQPEEKQVRFGLLKQLREKKAGFVAFLVTGCLITGFVESVMGLAVPIYATRLGYSLLEVGIILGASAAISVVFLNVFGNRLQKSGRNEYSMIAMLLVGGIASLAMIFFNSIIWLVVLMGVFVTGRAGGLNTAKSFISDNMPEKHGATGMSMADMMQYVGRMAGPLAAGLMLDFIGAYAVFTSVFVVAVIGSLIMLFYARFLRQKRNWIGIALRKPV